MNLRLAYTDAEEKKLRSSQVWTEFANTTEERRPLECVFDYKKIKSNEGYEYECESLFIFQLGSVPHKRYLVNLKLPVNIADADGSPLNNKIGQLSAIELIVSIKI